MIDPSPFFIKREDSLREAIQCIDRNAKGIALVVDSNNHLLGTISDGDVRRAILGGISLQTPVGKVLENKADSPYPVPITAPVDTERSILLSMMQQRSIRQLPLLDGNGRVVEMVTLEELLPRDVLPLQAVIMAGGKGARLRPLTEEIPKPMLPLGDRPIMEHIIEQLQQSGIRRVNVTTNYLSEKIMEHFGDGDSLGVEINYLAEDEPLGTAGALGLLQRPTEPLLVINGDILTRLDFRSMLSFHRRHSADMTVAVRQYDLQVPYGVMQCDGPYIRQVHEKPQYNFLVNAGIYLLEPSVYQLIPSGEHFDMTDLIERLLAEGQEVVSFPVVEYWLDIGQHEDYLRAQQDIENWESNR